MEHFLNKQICEVLFESKSEQLVKISVVVPVYNKEEIIEKFLVDLVNSMINTFELILIDDSSEDESNRLIRKSIENILETQIPLLTKVILVTNTISQFEAKCDQIGISLARSEFILEIQSDMFIDDPGFDERLFLAMKSVQNCVIVSGRGIERIQPIAAFYRSSAGIDFISGISLFKLLIKLLVSVFSQFIPRGGKNTSNDNIEHCEESVEFKPDDIRFLKTGEAGRLGMEILKYIPDKVLKTRKVYVGETVMRGPLLINKSEFESFGGLNTKCFFQGFDEHDFCLRALLRGKKVAYTPVRFYSPLIFGSTRQKRSSKLLYNLLRVRYNRRESELFQLSPSKIFSIEFKIHNF
jgi:glycosyltransferase involved in cell wall biosynthesis